MFKWYQKAGVCYAYLSDVPGQDHDYAALRKSRWFRRGWTLQELIAPPQMIFFASDWSQIGPRQYLRAKITEICSIEEEYLTGHADMTTASIAKKMSWVALRQTTRKEDLAYCLMGIFDINMPLLYGEGEKAFRRLQEVIITQYPEDHSIYAWGEILDRGGLASPPAIEQWPDKPVTEKLVGLLAKSPSDFSASQNVMPVPWTGRFYRFRLRGMAEFSPPVIIGKSIKVDFPVLYTKIKSPYQWDIAPEMTQTRPGIMVVLLCTISTANRNLILLPLISWGDGYLGRTNLLTTANDIQLELEDPSTLLSMQQTLFVTDESRVQPSPYDFVIRDLEVRQRENLQLWGWVTQVGVSLKQEKIVTAGKPSPGDLMAYNFVCRSQDAGGFSIIIGRDQHYPGTPSGPYLKVVPRDPPFTGLDWSGTADQKYYLQSRTDYQPVPVPMSGIETLVRWNRVMVSQASNPDNDKYIDVLDLRVDETNNGIQHEGEHVLHVVGTISMILKMRPKYTTQRQTSNGWRDRLLRRKS